MILTQVSVHSNERDADDSDWTLRRVAETCGTSPARPTPPWKGWHPAQANSEKPDSQVTQPAEKPLTSLENGPLNDPGTDLHNNKKPETVPFTGFFFYQGSGSNRRVGSKMWTLEVCRQYASAITEPFTRSSSHPLPCLIPLHYRKTKISSSTSRLLPLQSSGQRLQSRFRGEVASSVASDT